MDSILTEIKSTVRDDGIKPQLIEKNSTVKEISATEARPRHVKASIPSASFKTTDDVISLLKAELDYTTLRHILKKIHAATADEPLNLGLPGPAQARVIYVLVHTIIPSFWQTLESTDRTLLAACLASVAGINAVIANLQRTLTRSKEAHVQHRQLELLQLVASILKSTQVVVRQRNQLSSIAHDATRYALVWKEVSNCFGSAKFISIAAEVSSSLRQSGSHLSVPSLAGSDHAEWLARNIHTLSLQEGASSDAAQILNKAFTLGYNESIVKTLSELALREDNLSSFLRLALKLSTTSKRRLLEALSAWLSSSIQIDSPSSWNGTIASSMAALLKAMTSSDDAMLTQLATLVSDPQTSSSTTLAFREAALFVLADDHTYDLSALTDKAISVFGDSLFINHALIQQQEALAQTILISAGHLHRKSPAIFASMLRSSRHLQGVSNRLASSSPRARWLGMIVGTGLSRLVDKPGSIMDFGTTDVQTPESKEWLALSGEAVQSGDAKRLFQAIEAAKRKKELSRRQLARELPIIEGKQTYGPVRPPGMSLNDIQGDRITEVDDDEDDDDLVPYAKPDSDPEDSDEDATLVNRNKPGPPVYIRTLMTMLRGTENAEKFQLAIKYAAPLIRRKTGFGREVSDHAEELARMLANLQDPFDTDDFDTLRLQALVAVVLSDVVQVAPWLSRQAFAKDYCIAQRAVMLTALGLGGRELAGFREDDQMNPQTENVAFPSKMLPARLHGIYAPPMLEAATKSVEASMIQPMALAAADQTTSHLDAVKVRKFSSRMDVERTKRRPVANDLAKVFHTSYFAPLTASFQQELAYNGDSSAYASSSVLMATYLKTLALLLHAAGPACSLLDQITAEFWDLLLYLRVKAVGDVSVLEAILFSLLTLLEVNNDKQSLATNFPKQLMETKEWAEMVFERTGGGNMIEGEGEQARVRTLCAGVLTRIGEIITQYQKALMGGWSGID